jgi:AcrR family transcriptional regulator
MPTTQVPKAPGSREKVIKAATALFAARGFGGTSTRDVARKARVNEITVFRLFKNKQDLYLQVLDQKIGLSTSKWLFPALQTSDDPEKAFLSLAERVEEIFDPIFLRLLFYAALERPALLRKRYQPGLASLYETLQRQILERVESDVLRDVEPTLMGPALVGMIAYHQIVRELLGGRDFVGCDVRHAARVYTDIWLRGALKPEALARERFPSESTMQLPETTTQPERSRGRRN